MLDHTQQHAKEAAGREVMMMWSCRGQVIDRNLRKINFDSRRTIIHTRKVCPLLLLLLGSRVAVL